ncbi:ankyrin repeat-containing domain protein, partial [Russula brevipes]
NGHLDIARLFLEHGVDANVPNNYHSAPLHLAIYGGHLEVARLLIENGANEGHEEIVKLFSDHGIETREGPD